MIAERWYVEDVFLSNNVNTRISDVKTSGLICIFWLENENKSSCCIMLNYSLFQHLKISTQQCTQVHCEFLQQSNFKVYKQHKISERVSERAQQDS